MSTVKITLIQHGIPTPDIEHFVETQDPKALEVWIDEHWPDNRFHLVETITEKEFRNRYAPKIKTG